MAHPVAPPLVANQQVVHVSYHALLRRLTCSCTPAPPVFLPCSPEVSDAVELRKRIAQKFELASLPGTSDKDRWGARGSGSGAFVLRWDRRRPSSVARAKAG